MYFEGEAVLKGKLGEMMCRRELLISDADLEVSCISSGLRILIQLNTTYYSVLVYSISLSMDCFANRLQEDVVSEFQRSHIPLLSSVHSHVAHTFCIKSREIDIVFKISLYILWYNGAEG